MGCSAPGCSRTQRFWHHRCWHCGSCCRGEMVKGHPTWMPAPDGVGAAQNLTQRFFERGKPVHAAKRGAASPPSALQVCQYEHPHLQHIQGQGNQHKTAFCRVCLTLEQFLNPAHAGAAQTLSWARGKGELWNGSKGLGRRATPSHSSTRLQMLKCSGNNRRATRQSNVPPVFGTEKGPIVLACSVQSLYWGSCGEGCLSLSLTIPQTLAPPRPEHS